MPQIQILPGAPGFGSQLGQALGGGLSQGIGVALNEMLEQKKINTLERELQTRGLPKPLARLGAVATRGGQTEIVKHFLDQYKRDLDPTFQALQQQQQETNLQPEQQLNLQGQSQQPQQQITPQQKALTSSDIGLTPKERVGREKERYSAGLPYFEENSKKLNASRQTGLLLNTLDSLNERGNLPSDLGRINVDTDGNLKLPFLASADTQRFVKTINEFTRGAKESYGARVTNFDLGQFLLRLPTLMNTQEGRRQIIQQMKLMNDLDKKAYKDYQKIYKEAGGIRKIDFDKVQDILDERLEPEIEKINNALLEIGKSPEEKFKLGQEFDKLPKASEMKGVTITLPSGEDIRSNGNKWIKVKK